MTAGRAPGDPDLAGPERALRAEVAGPGRPPTATARSAG